MVDLHSHTQASDGTCTPAQLVERAARAHLEALAITDHDTVDGLPEGMAAGARLGVRIIPGVELSATAQREIHILGLGIDPEAPELKAALEAFKDQRRQRTPVILENLSRAGMPLPLEAVQAFAKGDILSRSHIAQAMVRAGYVASIAEAFSKYLAIGKPCYVPRPKMTCAQAIGLIRGAGGLAVLAHPYQMELSMPLMTSLIAEMQREGLAGIEAYYWSHTQQQCRALRALAQRMGLLVTGGSDFHGENRPDVQLGDGGRYWAEQRADVARLEDAMRAAQLNKHIEV